MIGSVPFVSIATSKPSGASLRRVIAHESIREVYFPVSGMISLVAQLGSGQHHGVRADLRAVLRTFAEISGLNIVIDPSIQGTVDVSLRDVPWDQALDIILRANRLGYSVDGTIVRIAPLTVLAELGILGFALYEWFSNDLYAVNGRDTLLYMGALYVLAIAIYVGSRIYRRNQGIDMRMVHSEIPVE